MLTASSTPWTVLTVIMERVYELEPRLQNFLEGFPCPPPWKEELIHHLNWTGCIGAEMGERAKMYMVDKCKIGQDGGPPYPGDNGGKPFPGNGGGTGSDDDGVMKDEDCGQTCQIIVSLVSVLMIVLVVIIIIYCVRRKRAKAASPSHQSSLTAHADGNAKYYTSCHYACTPVRQLQTSLNGNGTETRVVDNSDNNSLYTPGMYPQHNCQSPVGYNPAAIHPHHHPHHPHPHHPHYHHPQHLLHQQQQQPTRYIQTPYGQVPAHTSSLVVPQNSRFNISHYHRKFDPTYSSSSVTNSDRSPVYESIDDADSIRERTQGGRQTSMSECDFCECCLERANNDQGFYSGYMDLESDTYTDKLGTSGFPPDIEPPCPPLCSDGYYEDQDPRHSQTLPLRPIRGHPSVSNTGSNPLNKSADFSALQDSSELSPLSKNQQQQEPLLPTVKDNNTNNTSVAANNSNSNEQPLIVNGNGNGDGNGDQRVGGIRRRPSSNGSSHYAEGNQNGGSQRRPIPALHANYFVPNNNNTEEIS